MQRIQISGGYDATPGRLDRKRPITAHSPTEPGCCVESETRACQQVRCDEPLPGEPATQIATQFASDIEVGRGLCGRTVTSREPDGKGTKDGPVTSVQASAANVRRGGGEGGWTSS